MKYFLCFCFLWEAILSLSAQNDYISNSRMVEEDRMDDLDGDCGVLLLSRHDDLVIALVQEEERQQTKQIKIFADGQREDGMYEYRVIINKDFTRNPKLEVSREGSVYHTEFTTVVRPDFLIAFLIEDVGKPIRVDDQTQPNDLRKNEKEAELEFSTTIQGLQIIVSPRLQAQIKTKTSAADASVHITSVVIPIAVLVDAKQAMLTAKETCDTWSSQLTEGKIPNIDANWEKLEELEQKRDAAEAAYIELCNVEIYGDETNRLTIDISDLTPKAKKSYVVLPLTIEKKVYVTAAAAYMAEGARLFSTRKYAEAKEAYLQAQKAADLAPGMRASVAESITLCDTCRHYDLLGKKVIKEVLRMKREGGTQNEMAKFAFAGIEFFQQASNYNPSVFYTKCIQSLETLLSHQPLFMKFTIVEWKKTLQEGDFLSGVEIWAYFGKKTLPLSEYSSDRKFKKCMEKQGLAFRQIGISDIDGKVEFEFDRTHLPLGIFFRPQDDNKAKIAYMSMAELQRKSQGDFMKRQFRMKMFVK